MAAVEAIALNNGAYFSRQEYDSRLAAVRAAMAKCGVDLLLASSPENIFYLTGLDHWGYFAPHVLMVPPDGEMVLCTRAMEKATVANQVGNARFEGHGDGETVADTVERAVAAERVSARAVGIEAWSSGLPHGLAEALKKRFPNARWVDVTGLVDDLRMVKSPAEQVWMRRAAAVSDAGADAAMAAVRTGASERHVAAECQRAMIEAGGTFPGFGPFVRSTARLGEEHTTWTDHRFIDGEAAFLELAGCVARYHAPLGRLIHIGRASAGAGEMAAVCRDAFDAVLVAMKPGAAFGDVYAAWQAVVDRAGLSHYRRHHCGYVVGIGFPPTWTGGNRVTGLRAGCEINLKAGMAFHVLSWLMGTGRGDFFMSNTVLLGSGGPEVLTRTPAGIAER